MEPSLHDPEAYLKAHLVHPRIEELHSGEGVLYCTQNVVSNMMLDPEGFDENGNLVPQQIPLMKLLNASQPYSEHKQSFGAAIVRFITPLTEEQHQVPEAKQPANTNLCFGTGALGSTGNRSKEEAIYANHCFRLHIERSLGIKTSFRRFNIPNTVCTTSLGYPINLAKMHAAAPLQRPYYPDVFPGLFFFYNHVYEDRTAFYEKVIGSNLPAKKRLCLVEGDLEQFQNSLHHGPVSADARAAAIAAASSRNISERKADDPVVKEVQAAFTSYLPPKEKLALLVFGGGNVVGLVFNNPQVGQEAFRSVMEVAREFRLSEEEAAQFYEQQKTANKKKKSQSRVKAKASVLEESFNINYRKQISEDGIKRIGEIVNRVEDEVDRQRQIQGVLKEEASKKKKRGAKRREDEIDEEFAGIIPDAPDADVEQATHVDFDIDAQLDALLAAVDEDEGHAAEAAEGALKDLDMGLYLLSRVGNS